MCLYQGPNSICLEVHDVVLLITLNTSTEKELSLCLPHKPSINEDKLFLRTSILHHMSLKFPLSFNSSIITLYLMEECCTTDQQYTKVKICCVKHCTEVNFITPKWYICFSSFNKCI